jgi:hypothetical protein
MVILRETEFTHAMPNAVKMKIPKSNNQTGTGMIFGKSISAFGFLRLSAIAGLNKLSNLFIVLATWNLFFKIMRQHICAASIPPPIP